MPAHRCDRHVRRGPEDYRPNGRCAHCAREASRKYGQKCREARRRLAAIEALIA